MIQLHGFLCFGASATNLPFILFFAVALNGNELLLYQLHVICPRWHVDFLLCISSDLTQACSRREALVTWCCGTRCWTTGRRQCCKTQIPGNPCLSRWKRVLTMCIRYHYGSMQVLLFFSIWSPHWQWHYADFLLLAFARTIIRLPSFCWKTCQLLGSDEQYVELFWCSCICGILWTFCRICCLFNFDLDCLFGMLLVNIFPLHISLFSFHSLFNTIADC